LHADHDEQTGQGAILWDVIAEHLDEAGFALDTWTQALESPLYTLQELARGPEEQLLAHLDALVIGGPPVAQRLLEPLLAPAPEPRPALAIVPAPVSSVAAAARGTTPAPAAPLRSSEPAADLAPSSEPAPLEAEPPTEQEPEPTKLAAAALALLAGGRSEAVQGALTAAPPRARQAAGEALALAGTAELDAWLASRLSSPLAVPERRALLPLAAARGVSLPDLLEALRSDDPAELATAALAARYAPAGPHAGAVEQLTAHPDPAVREAALVTALCFGSPIAFRRCLALAGEETPAPLAMLLVALLGGPQHQRLLLEQLARESHRHAALRAVGLCGQVAAVPALLAQLDAEDPLARRLIAEAVMLLTGLDTGADAIVAPPPPEPDSLPPLEEDDLEADLVPPVEEELPLPDPAALRALWGAHAASFAGRERSRLLLGEPWSVRRVLELLPRLSLRERHPLALWLLIRSGGAARLDTRALSRTQEAQLAALQGLSEQALVHRFEGV